MCQNIVQPLLLSCVLHMYIIMFQGRVLSVRWVSVSGRDRGRGG
jgi:hypothetical protein